MQISSRLRAFVRAWDSSVVLLAIPIGVLGGLVVIVMGSGVDFLHTRLFHLTNGERLSAQTTLQPVLALSIPLLGGLILGLAAELIGRWRRNREVDPIEANALRGGRMSLLGSLIVAAQTVWSSGVGASVGLEAGYTQLASGIASRLGSGLGLRRSDLRILVGCGAAAGIAGAFGAPLTGAFYGFELIIGTYSPTGLAPVGISALLGFLVARSMGFGDPGVATPDVTVPIPHDLLLAVPAGLLCAMMGVTLMRGVALSERLFQQMSRRPAVRGMVGGLLVGLMVFVSPHIMSSGHGALHIIDTLDASLRTLAIVFLLKIIASIVSLGAGFRGGLFFSSLLIGALGGHLLADTLTTFWPAVHFDTNTAAIISMSALSASVIGAPMTMTFFALESTGNLWLTTAVLVTVIISAHVTQRVFGYSFATWRFHLRGETIRSAADISWMRDLTVETMMNKDVQTEREFSSIAAFREAFPLGSGAYVVAVDEHDRYTGLILVADAHGASVSPDGQIKKLSRHADDQLLPGTAVKEAILAFERADADALVVIDSFLDRRVVGILTESYVLRRYSAALEGSRRDLVGESL